eukprot:SAG31_NODE_1771_length_7309_cov_4.269626_3_plen_69_part_00
MHRIAMAFLTARVWTVVTLYAPQATAVRNPKQIYNDQDVVVRLWSKCTYAKQHYGLATKCKSIAAQQA